MIHKAKDLSPDQRLAIESLLGRSIGENEEIIIRTADSPSAPEWLRRSWKSAQEQGLDGLSSEEIDTNRRCPKGTSRAAARRAMIRIVLDTNIFVSSLLQPQGLPAEILPTTKLAEFTGSWVYLW